jgi:adenine-specific DNA-methyltransferase
VDCTINKTADERPNLYYAIKNPITGEEILPSKQRTWAFEAPRMRELIDDKRLWWGEDGTNFPRLKAFLSEVQAGVVPSTLWLRDDFGDNQESSRELQQLFAETYGVFDNPKPTRLILRDA